tara:strand:- start:24418 stop:25158 length:741 start_codon:yes stop_codon:yes gene_type:complete
MKQIVCMKWGSLYGPDYVNKLYAMVKRNIDGEFRFVCLTDDPREIRQEVECLYCPEVDIPAPFNNTGWRKIALWAESLPSMQGNWLFLDLDVVITGTICSFFDFKPEQPFVVMKNWTQPGSGIGNTSVYRFTVGCEPSLLDQLIKQPLAIVEEFKNEQTFVSRSLQHVEFWPDHWCILFKTHCVPSMPMRWWKEPCLPKSAKIVAFPGDPNPDMAAIGQWSCKSAYKRIYKTIRPAHWINEHWHEA